MICFAFIFTGTKFYLKLRKANAEIAVTMRWRIFLSVLIISSLFMFRAVFSIVRGITYFDRSWEEDAWTNNAIGFPIFIFFYNLVVNILPILFLMLSVRMVVRNQKRLSSNGALNYSQDEFSVNGINPNRFTDFLPDGMIN